MGCFAVCLQHILTLKVPNAIQYFKVDDKKLSSACSYHFPLWRERRMGRGIVPGDKKSCVSSPIPLFHTTPPRPPPPPPHPTLKQTVDGTILNDARKEYTSRNSMVYWLAQIARKRQVSIADSYRCLYRVRKPLPLGKMYVRPRFDGIRYSKRKQHFSSLKE